MRSCFKTAPCSAEAKSLKTEPGEVTSPPHPSNKKDDGIKRGGESQELNDSDEDDEEEEGDLLEEEEVRLLHPGPLFIEGTVYTQIANIGSVKYHK